MEPSPDTLEIDALEKEVELKESDAQKLKTAVPKKTARQVQKVKTANQLDERFQLRPEHDAEHIFDEERDMIQELRNQIEDLRFYTDKWICYWLFSRRHDLPAVQELLKKYLQLREELGWRTKMPDIHSPGVQDLIADRLMFRMPGAVDNQNRMLLTFFMSHSRPHGRLANDLIAFSMWEVDYLVQTEPLANLRNGMVWVTDMTGFSLFKHVDMSAEGKKWSNAVSGVFPNRIRAIWVVHAGWMLRAVMAAAKLFFPKKLAKRFAVMKETDLLAHVPKEHLPKHLGGEREVDWDQMWEIWNINTEKMEKRWKKIRKALRKEQKESN